MEAVLGISCVDLLGNTCSCHCVALEESFASGIRCLVGQVEANRILERSCKTGIVPIVTDKPTGMEIKSHN